MRSREYDLDFRDRAGRTRAWGIGLLSLATLLWAWCAVLLLTPYEADRTDALAVLGLSVPVSVVGVALFTTGTLSRRMSAHAEAMRELDRIADAKDARDAAASR